MKRNFVVTRCRFVFTVKFSIVLTLSFFLFEIGCIPSNPAPVYHQTKEIYQQKFETGVVVAVRSVAIADDSPQKNGQLPSLVNQLVKVLAPQPKLGFEIVVKPNQRQKTCIVVIQEDDPGVKEGDRVLVVYSLKHGYARVVPQQNKK